MAIVSTCPATVTVCQSEGIIRVFVLFGGVYSCLHERDRQLPLSLYLFCVNTVVVAPAITRVCLACIVACSERDIAYATISVRFV